MVAPQVVVVQRLQILAHRNHAGTGGVERDGGHGASVNAGGAQRLACGRGQGSHLVCVGLSGEVGIFAAAMQRVGGRCGADGSALAVHQGNAHAQGAEIDAGNDCHGSKPPSKRFLARPQEYTISPRLAQAPHFVASGPSTVAALFRPATGPPGSSPGSKSAGSTDQTDCSSPAATGRHSRAPGSPGRRARRPAAAGAARSWRGRPTDPSCCSSRRWSTAWRRCGPRSAGYWAASSVPRPAAPAAPVRCRSGARCRSR